MEVSHQAHPLLLLGMWKKSSFQESVWRWTRQYQILQLSREKPIKKVETFCSNIFHAFDIFNVKIHFGGFSTEGEVVLFSILFSMQAWAQLHHIDWLTSWWKHLGYLLYKLQTRRRKMGKYQIVSQEGAIAPPPSGGGRGGLLCLTNSPTKGYPPAIVLEILVCK